MLKLGKIIRELKRDQDDGEQRKNSKILLIHTNPWALRREKNIFFRFAKGGERKARDSNQVKCIKDEEGDVFRFAKGLA